MTGNVIRLAMIGCQPTIKNHQTKDKRKKHKQDKNVLTIVALYL